MMAAHVRGAQAAAREADFCGLVFSTADVRCPRSRALHRRAHVDVQKRGLVEGVIGARHEGDQPSRVCRCSPISVPPLGAPETDTPSSETTYPVAASRSEDDACARDPAPYAQRSVCSTNSSAMTLWQ